MSDVPLLTEAEAGLELRVSKRTITREREAGKIDFIRIRGRVFIPKDAIEEYLKRCRNTASNDAPAPPAGISFGQRAGEASAARRAKQIARGLTKF